MSKKTKKNLESIINIKLTFESDNLAKAIDQSTSPENIETPKNVKAYSKIHNNELHLTIESVDSLQNLLTTVDDYLEKIDLSYKTIKSMKKD